MKILFSFVLLVSMKLTADCNLPIALAAGQYINELEKAKLRSYQNNSVCEVLNYEFWNCSQAQLNKMKKYFDVKQVLGNYCQPHLPPPSDVQLNKDTTMKGLDLYSWKTDQGYMWYALLPGKNGLRQIEELIQNKISEGYLKTQLKNIPQGTEIVWNNLVSLNDRGTLEFTFPTGKTTDQFNQVARKAKIKLTRATIHQ